MRQYFAKTGIADEAIKLLKYKFKKNVEIDVSRQYVDNFAPSPMYNYPLPMTRDEIAEQWNELVYKHGFVFKYKSSFDSGRVTFLFAHDSQKYWFILRLHRNY